MSEYRTALLDLLESISMLGCQTDPLWNSASLSQSGGISPVPGSLTPDQAIYVILERISSLAQRVEEFSKQQTANSTDIQQLKLEVSELRGRVGVLEEFKKTHETDSRNEDTAKKQPHWMVLALGGAAAMTIIQVLVSAIKAWG
jgi:hypothetical protein